MTDDCRDTENNRFIAVIQKIRTEFIPAACAIADKAGQFIIFIIRSAKTLP